MRAVYLHHQTTTINPHTQGATANRCNKNMKAVIKLIQSNVDTFAIASLIIFAISLSAGIIIRDYYQVNTFISNACLITASVSFIISLLFLGNETCK